VQVNKCSEIQNYQHLPKVQLLCLWRVPTSYNAECTYSMKLRQCALKRGHRDTRILCDAICGVLLNTFTSFGAVTAEGSSIPRNQSINLNIRLYLRYHVSQLMHWTVMILWHIYPLLDNASVNAFMKHTLSTIRHPLLSNGLINTHSW
jgi:hypothetical protein